MEDSLLPTLPAMGKSGAVTLLLALPRSRATASPVLGGGGVGWEEDVLDDTGVLLPATAALAEAINLEGRHRMSLTSSNSPCLPSAPLHNTAPAPSTTSSSGEREPVPAPRTPPAQHVPTSKAAL